MALPPPPPVDGSIGASLLFPSGKWLSPSRSLVWLFVCFGTLMLSPNSLSIVESTEVQLEAASSLDVSGTLSHFTWVSFNADLCCSDTSTGDDTDVPQSMSVGASPETDIRSMSLRSSAGRGEGKP